MSHDHLELARLTRDEVAARAADAVLVVPTAAVEQHGPHLPLGTDALIGEAVAREALSRVEDADRFVLAPVLPYGSSHHHLAYAALSLGSGSFLAAVADLLRSAVSSGFRRVYVLNSHGGNVEGVRQAARDVALTREAVIGSCSYWDVSRAAIAEAGTVAAGLVPGHAGQFETSLMLAIAPELVRLDRLPRGDHAGPLAAGVSAEGSAIEAHGDWTRMDGFTDVPASPSAETGRALLRVIGERVADALAEFRRLSDAAVRGWRA
ncbi:MAG TPA: creatininase family protein [Trueperaceae bacterium]